MKKQIVMLALAGMLSTSLVACKGGKLGDATTEATTSAEKNISTQYVTLGEYKGLNIEKKVYTITDEDVQDEIDSALDENAEYKEITERAAKKGDIITVSYEGSVDGKALEDAKEEEYDFEIGIEEFGKKFDDGLIGMKVGDKKTITVSFDKDYEDSSWAGKTIDFKVKASAINEKILPEYNDKFVSEYYDCSTTEEYEGYVRENLEKEYESDSEDEAGSDALEQVVSNAAISGYPQDLYDSCYQEVKEGYESYAEYFNADASEIYNMFGMTEDDLKQEAMDLVNQRLVINAIAVAENISVSEEDYKNSVDQYVEDWGCEDQQELEETYGVDAVKQEMLKQKVMQYLLDNANITEVDASIYDEEQ